MPVPHWICSTLHLEKPRIVAITVVCQQNYNYLQWFLAHLALPKWAYIIMIHEMDPNMGS